MDADEGYFGERVAASYDQRSASMFDPAVLGPAVDRLAQRIKELEEEVARLKGSLTA